MTTSTRVDAPREGRQATRVNWLLRQLVQASDGLRLTGTFAGTRDTSSVLLGEAREDPIRLSTQSIRDAKSERSKSR